MNELIEEMDKFFRDSHIELSYWAETGNCGFSLKDAYEVFKEYKDDPERYKVEFVWELTQAEWVEYQKLVTTELDDSFLRCCGINANGSRCKAVVSDSNMLTKKQQLEKMREKNYYCKKHSKEDGLVHAIKKLY